MKTVVTNAITLKEKEITAILVKALKLPEGTVATFTLREAGDQRDYYKVFDSITLTHKQDIEF